MSTSVGPKPIVVGFDGSETAYAALDWALGEATRRHTRVVAVLASGSLFVPSPMSPLMNGWPDEAADALLEEARKHAARRSPGTVVHVVSSIGGAAGVLVHGSKSAGLVVLGGPRHSRLGELVLGATAPQVVGHAHCPVVIVPTPEEPPGDGPVVVGVDGSVESSAAIAFAFEHAAQTGRPVVALHAWWLDVPDLIGTSMFSAEALAEIEAVHREATAAAVRDLVAANPDVPTQQVVVRDDPVRALLEAAEQGGLIVVGSRGHGGFAGLMLGSVSQGLLHARLPCPLVVTHSPAG